MGLSPHRTNREMLFPFTTPPSRLLAGGRQGIRLLELDDDPHPALAEHVIATPGREGTACTYSGYKRQALPAPREALVDRTVALRAMKARLFDFTPVLSNGCHHPAFRSSLSLEVLRLVLVTDPACAPIADGQTVMARQVATLEHQCVQAGIHCLSHLRNSEMVLHHGLLSRSRY